MGSLLWTSRGEASSSVPMLKLYWQRDSTLRRIGAHGIQVACNVNVHLRGMSTSSPKWWHHHNTGVHLTLLAVVAAFSTMDVDGESSR